MSSFVRLAAIAGVSIVMAAPAYAQAAPSGPEMVDVALLGAGVAGLVLGRLGSRSRSPRQD